MPFGDQELGQDQVACENGAVAKDDEVYVVQFIRPSGRRSVQVVTIGVELAAKARAINAGLSAEVLSTGQVAVYGLLPTMKEQDEFLMVAMNSPGPDSPGKVVARMVEKLVLETTTCHECGGYKVCRSTCKTGTHPRYVKKPRPTHYRSSGWDYDEGDR